MTKRLTKQQQREKQEMEKKAISDKFRIEYNQKLIDIIYTWLSCTSENRIEPIPSGFEFDSTGTSNLSRLFLPKSLEDYEDYDIFNLMDEIESIEFVITNIKSKQDEEKRIAMLRATAISKLTVEEREILGVR